MHDPIIRKLSDKFKKPVYSRVMDVKVKIGDVIMVAGYTKTGKTHWLVKATKQIKERVIFFSLEMEWDIIMTIFAKFYTADEMKNNENVTIITEKKLPMSWLENKLKTCVVPKFIFFDDPCRIYMDDGKPRKPFEQEIDVFNRLEHLCEKYKMICFLTGQINPEGKDNPSSVHLTGSKEKARLVDAVIILTEKDYSIEMTRNDQFLVVKDWKKKVDDKNQINFLDKEED